MVASVMKCAANPRESYQWVWAVGPVETKKGQTVPIVEGDRLFICIEADGKVRFFHRTKRDPKNTALWNNACAILCESTGIIVGTFSDGRTFKMTITEDEDGLQINCNHRINPDEGDWSGREGSDPT